MSRSIKFVLALSLASCGYDGYYGVEFGAPVYQTPGYDDGGWLWTSSPGQADHWDYSRYPWYYQPAPAPQRDRPQERAPQAPLQPPPAEPVPQADDDRDRDPK